MAEPIFLGSYKQNVSLLIFNGRSQPNATQEAYNAYASCATRTETMQYGRRMYAGLTSPQKTRFITSVKSSFTNLGRWKGSLWLKTARSCAATEQDDAFVEMLQSSPARRTLSNMSRNTHGMAMIMFKPLPVGQNGKALERGNVGKQFCSNFEARYLMDCRRLLQTPGRGHKRSRG